MVACRKFRLKTPCGFYVVERSSLAEKTVGMVENILKSELNVGLASCTERNVVFNRNAERFRNVIELSKKNWHG